MFCFWRQKDIMPVYGKGFLSLYGTMFQVFFFFFFAVGEICFCKENKPCSLKNYLSSLCELHFVDLQISVSVGICVAKHA